VKQNKTLGKLLKLGKREIDNLILVKSKLESQLYAFEAILHSLKKELENEREVAQGDPNLLDIFAHFYRANIEHQKDMEFEIQKVQEKIMLIQDSITNQHIENKKYEHLIDAIEYQAKIKEEKLENKEFDEISIVRYANNKG
jgi:hypothetical protein